MKIKDPVMSNSSVNPSPNPLESGLSPDHEDPSWDYGDPFEAARVIWTGAGATGAAEATGERSPHVPTANR